VAPVSVEVFAGVRVVEVAQYVFVPVAGALLADWGADVIKIEHPLHGDGYRGLVSQGILQITDGINQSVELANRGKRSLGLDITTPDGRDLLLRLIETADVFLTNFLPSTITRLQLDVEDLRQVNSSLIYARGHGFGVRGPDAGKAAYDATAFWARGAVGETLTPPQNPEPIAQRGAFGDRISAAQLAFGIASALFRRERTGEPSIVDVSLLASAMWTLGSDVISALQGNFKEGPPPGGGHNRNNPVSNSYKTKDGRFISLSLLQSDRYWADFCGAIGRPEMASEPRFIDAAARAENNVECIALLDEVFASRTFAMWCDAFAAESFPWAPFQRVPELVEDRQVAANGYLGEVVVESGTNFRLPTGAVQFDEMPATLSRGPETGEHTESLLIELGLSWAAIGKYKAAGIVT
jgi:crotonobetainyl-CoA:carnitine CoA-transferase CaiB-like acyl-CoA transferase